MLLIQFERHAFDHESIRVTHGRPADTPVAVLANGPGRGAARPVSEQQCSQHSMPLTTYRQDARRRPRCAVSTAGAQRNLVSATKMVRAPIFDEARITRRGLGVFPLDLCVHSLLPFEIGTLNRERILFTLG